jgi:pimeloyl-ACP methyl ester carboxylesterase
VARLATRSWGPPDPLAPGAPDPRAPGTLDPRAPGTLDPRAPGGGAPEREGSRPRSGAREAVHRAPGRPLALLVHGVTSSSRTWWRVGPALVGRGYEVVAVDLRAHGASGRAVAGLGVADLAADVAETVQGPVELLVGHSLGALVALELVGRRPGFARRLVVEDPPGPSSIDWAAVAAGIEDDTAQAATVPEALRRELEAANPAWPPGEAERRVADLADCDGQAVAAAFRGGVPFDLASALAAARLPVLMLLGEEALGSILTGLDRTAAVDALPDGITRVLPTGHNLHREALDAWLAALDAWLTAS